MSADAVMTAIVVSLALFAGGAHAIVWFFWPEIR